jgi:hypothetical protein
MTVTERVCTPRAPRDYEDWTWLIATMVQMEYLGYGGGDRMNNGCMVYGSGYVRLIWQIHLVMYLAKRRFGGNDEGIKDWADRTQ